MDFILVCTDKQFAEFISKKAKRYELMGVLLICTVIVFWNFTKI